MTAVYRMSRSSWTPDQAFKEMKQFKFGADFLHCEYQTIRLCLPRDAASCGDGYRCGATESRRIEVLTAPNLYK